MTTTSIIPIGRPTYSNRQNAVAAARKALGRDAAKDKDFVLEGPTAEGRYAWQVIVPADATPQPPVKKDADEIPAFLKRDAKEHADAIRASQESGAGAAFVEAARKRSSKVLSLSTPKPTSAKPAKGKKSKGERPAGKGQLVIDMLLKKGGATMAQLSEATGWKPNSISSYVPARLRAQYEITSIVKDGEKVYSARPKKG